MKNFKFFRGYEKTQILRATWSPEIATDLETFHNIDAEAELTTLLSQEMSRMLDNEILTRLLNDINNRE